MTSATGRFFHFRHEYLAALHDLKALEHDIHNALDSDPEAGHLLVRERDDAARTLRPEKLDEAAAAADDVAVADDAYCRHPAAAVGVGRDGELLCGELRRTVEIDRLHRFVGRDQEDLPDARVYSRIDHILRSDDIRLDRFGGIIFGSGHLFERRRMHYDIDPMECAVEALPGRGCRR